ncbi:MAG TPA: hypothetical protein VN577_06680 [Terriglobales bacterium]|nr:hypothetical protein [Terriglobales bacterium]
MSAAVLIAGNFLREHRWAIVLLLLWAFGSGTAAAFSVSSAHEDALFFLKQQAMYSVFFTVFLAASALHNQRRSRRILAVLAKGIERYEYLGGVMLGFLTVSGLYSLALGITGAFTFYVAGANPAKIVPLMLMLFLASALAGTVALLFSTFLNPLLTLVTTGLVLGTSSLLPVRLVPILPAYDLMHAVMNFTFFAPVQVPWMSMLTAGAATVLLWLLASWVFSRRDVAVAVE